MVSGLPGQVRKKAAKVRIALCRGLAGKVSAFIVVFITVKMAQNNSLSHGYILEFSANSLLTH